MSETLKFKAFCLEQYKHEHNISGEQVIDLFNQYNVLNYLESFYDVLHTTGAKYIVEDIDLYIQSRVG